MTLRVAAAVRRMALAAGSNRGEAHVSNRKNTAELLFILSTPDRSRKRGSAYCRPCHSQRADPLHPPTTSVQCSR
jgi:hypothetical protein